jgi:peroxiredoxin
MIDVARILLAAVLLIAGIAKLRDPAGTRAALGQFHAPAWLVGPAALALPAAELALAGGLLAEPVARYAAGAATALLAVFAVAVAALLARGEDAECRCFGALSSGRVGIGTLVRNVGLVALGAIVVLEPPLPASPAAAAVTAVAAVAVAEAGVLVALLRRYGSALKWIDELEQAGQTAGGLDPGAEAPDFSIPSVSGETVSLGALRSRGRPVLLAFVDTECAPCRALLPELGRWQRVLVDRLTVAVIGRGDPTALQAAAGEHALELLRSPDDSVPESFGSRATPSALVVAADGTVASGMHYAAEGIRELVGEAAAGRLVHV